MAERIPVQHVSTAEDERENHMSPVSEKQTSKSNSRIFEIYESNSISSSTFTVVRPGGASPVSVEISQFKPGKPDLTLFTEHDDGGHRVLGVANFVTLSAQTKLGLGDPAVPNEILWEDLTKKRINYSQYRWEMTINGERRGFLWKRTHTVGAGKSVPTKLSSMYFKLISEQTRELLAVFAHPEWKSMTKSGQLEIHKSYGADFDVMILLSGLSLFEKARRRERRDPGLLTVEMGKRIVGSMS